LRGYAARRINSRLIDERRCIPPHLALDFGNEGLFGLLIEERFGGQALRVCDVARVLEQLAALDVGLCTWIITSVFAGTRSLSVWATEEIKAEWLPRLATGRVYGAYAQTEPRAGSDFTAIAAQARPAAGGGWLLQGHKNWVGNGSWSSIVTVISQLTDEDGAPLGITAFAVPMTAPGMLLGEEHLSLGLRGMVQSDIRFDDVAIAPSQMLGKGQGLLVAVDSMTMTRLALAAASLGAMKRSLQLAYLFGSRRMISHGRLCDHATTLATLGEIAAHIEASEAIVYWLASLLDDGFPVEMELMAAAKVMTTEWLGQAADRLVQLLGGRGYDEANLAAQLYRDVRVYRIFEGTTDALIDFLGARVMAQTERVDGLLKGTGALDVAAQLRAAIEELRHRKATPHAADVDYCGWRNALAGTALMWAFAVTAIRKRKGSGTRATIFVERRFEEALSEARLGNPCEAVIASSKELEEAVAMYSDRIGDVEQTLPGELTVLDPLLRSAKKQNTILGLKRS
jgi:alkylation response protein AidB-like acyl-CoA dehydrogenase